VSRAVPGDEGAARAGDTRDWRARKRDETRERIYTTAMRLFTEHGFDQVSVTQIAAAAGVSVPTFYAHFPSKEQVVMPVPTGEEVAAVIADLPTDVPLPERMQRAIRAWFAQFDGTELGEILARWRVVAASPSLRVRAAEYERATAALVLAALPPDRDGRAVRADDVVVTAYMAVLTAVLLAWAADEGRQPLGDLADEAFDTLRRA
jgi:AcrR family transcriptional regulator